MKIENDFSIQSPNGPFLLSPPPLPVKKGVIKLSFCTQTFTY